MISNSGDQDGVRQEIKRLVPNAEIPTTLRPNAIFGLKEEEMGMWKTDNQRKGGAKRSERKRAIGSFCVYGRRRTGPRK